MTQPQYPLNDTPLQPLPPGLVHDLRTPVSHIIGYSEMLIEQAQEAGKEGFIPDLQKVRAAGHELLTLINDRIYQAGQSDPIVTAVPEPTPQGQRAEIPGERPQVPGAAQGSLLVVDDNQGNRDVLSRRLKSQGYLVSTAENGRQALAMLGADPFDLVLLDIMMPEMDGYEVLATLKADEKLRHIPVIMISALSEMDSVVRCIELGAEDYLPKPFNPTLLKARIGACLEKKRGHDREADLFEQLQQNFTRLQELERLRDDLTNMIIHDLRRPLDSVIMGIQTLDALGDLNSGQRQVMDIAVKGGETLVRIINDLLEVENLESGTMQLDRVLLSVGELVASALKKVASEAECKQVTLVQQVPDDLPSLAGDETILRRSLVNLLGNAIKLTPSGGSVTVAAQLSESGNQVELSISDTGNGIPPDAFERIFDKFAQADASKRGAGLGLTYSKLAAESHGGQIGVESTLDQGTTFRVTLPLDSPSADQPSLQEFVALI
jgi:two-component system, sensor histidine kinase and response regulator